MIPCAIYAPGRRISQIAITTSNVPGALAKIASKMAELNINILSGLLMAEPGMEVGTVILFLDLTRSHISAERLVEELKALDVVERTEIVVRRVGHMAIDGTTHLTTFLGERAVVLDVDDVGAMFNWLVSTFGTGGKAILFDMGLRVGSSAARKLARSYGLRGRELVETFLALHAAAGWFDYELVSYDEEGRSFTLRLFENFECLSSRGQGLRDKPASVFVRGALTGLFREAYGDDLMVNETACVARGDAYCEFVIRRGGPSAS